MPTFAELIADPDSSYDLAVRIPAVRRSDGAVLNLDWATEAATTGSGDTPANAQFVARLDPPTGFRQAMLQKDGLPGTGMVSLSFTITAEIRADDNFDDDVFATYRFTELECTAYLGGRVGGDRGERLAWSDRKSFPFRIASPPTITETKLSLDCITDQDWLQTEVCRRMKGLGAAVLGNGTSTTIDMGDNFDLIPGQDRCWHLWVFVSAENVGASSIGDLFDKGDESLAISIPVDESGTTNAQVLEFTYTVKTDSGTFSILSPKITEFERFYFITCVIDSGVLKFYLDGVTDGSTATLSGTLNTNSNSFRFFSNTANTGDYFKGILGPIVFFDSFAPDQAQVTRLVAGPVVPESEFWDDVTRRYGPLGDALTDLPDIGPAYDIGSPVNGTATDAKRAHSLEGDPSMTNNFFPFFIGVSSLVAARPLSPNDSIWVVNDSAQSLRDVSDGAGDPYTVSEAATLFDFFNSGAPSAGNASVLLRFGLVWVGSLTHVPTATLAGTSLFGPSLALRGGISDHVFWAAATLNSFFASTFTLEFQMQAEEVLSGAILFDNRDTSGTKSGLIVHMLFSGSTDAPPGSYPPPQLFQITFRVFQSDGTVVAVTSPTIVLDETHAFSWRVIENGGTDAIQLYMDGFLVDTADLSLLLAESTRDLFMGRGSESPGAAFVGAIGDVRLWSVARSQAEIEQFYYRPLPLFAQTAPLAAYFFGNKDSQQPSDVLPAPFIDSSGAKRDGVMASGGGRWSGGLTPTGKRAQTALVMSRSGVAFDDDSDVHLWDASRSLPTQERGQSLRLEDDTKTSRALALIMQPDSGWVGFHPLADLPLVSGRAVKPSLAASPPAGDPQFDVSRVILASQIANVSQFNIQEPLKLLRMGYQPRWWDPSDEAVAVASDNQRTFLRDERRWVEFSPGGDLQHLDIEGNWESETAGQHALNAAVELYGNGNDLWNFALNFMLMDVYPGMIFQIATDYNRFSLGGQYFIAMDNAPTFKPPSSTLLGWRVLP